jgi:ABC-2 type transport system ATP-binding protein
VLTSDGGSVTALVSDADAFVRALVSSQTAFRDIAVRGATLEEAFLALTAVPEGTR